jgi:membrane-associated protease RseP (regulator of RpoE activity)
VVGVDGNHKATDDQFVSYTRSHVGEPITLTVLRDGRTLTVQATPVLAKVGEREVGRLGVTIDRRILTRQRVNPITGMGRAGLAVGSAVKLIVERLGDVFGPKGLGRIWDLIRGAQRTTNDVGSVVGGARLATEAAQTGAWDFLLELFVSFNLFVGILNLLPLPPLDGGHLAVVVAEKVTRRKVDPRALIPLTALVAGFLVLLMISLVYLDIVNPIPNPFR